MIAQAVVTLVFLLLVGCFALLAVLLIACIAREARDWFACRPRRRRIVVTDSEGGRRYA